MSENSTPNLLNSRVVKPHKGYRLGEDNKTLPWRITLGVQNHELEGMDHTVVYYVRGPNPDTSCMMAHQLWQKWEKFDLGLKGDFPDVTDYGEAMCIDEDDFRAAWREVKKYGLACRVAGSPEDPMAFTCIGRTSI